MSYKFIEGSVTAPKGFTAAGVCASVKPSNKTKKDAALIYCEKMHRRCGLYQESC